MIQFMREQGAPPGKIAKTVGCNRATVYRELARGLKDGCVISNRTGYSAELGQKNFDINLSKRGRKRG